MEKNPLEKVLNQIAELIQYVYDHADQPISPQKEKEVAAQLAELEAQVIAFKKLSESSIEGAEVNDFVVQNMMQDEKHEKINEVDRTFLLKAEMIKSEAIKASTDALRASNEAKATGRRLTDKKKQKPKSPQARKGKFKSMGGYKDWKPL